MKTKRVVTLGFFIASASVLHVVETWLPMPFPLPGAKLGLANIVSLLVIYLYGWRDALVVAVARVFLGSLLGGAILGPAFLMSMAGAVMSTFIMSFAFVRWQPQFSLIGISVLGAAAHNLSQIVVASLLIVNSGILWYLPYLIGLSVPVGVGTGLTAKFFLRKLPLSE